MSEPKRIQRRRTKGWRMLSGAIYVGRPTVFGNPWTLRDAASWGIPVGDRRKWAARQYQRDLRERGGTGEDWTGFVTLADIREQLAGRDLACWCPPDQPCHADVLLVVANGGAP